MLAGELLFTALVRFIKGPGLDLFLLVGSKTPVIEQIYRL